MNVHFTSGKMSELKLKASAHPGATWCSADVCIGTCSPSVLQTFTSETEFLRGSERGSERGLFFKASTGPDQERKLVSLLGKEPNKAWSTKEAAGFSPLWDCRSHGSLLISDTDYPSLQCGGCQHWIRHYHRQTKGQMELHKGVLDTNSCKYSLLCCYCENRISCLSTVEFWGKDSYPLSGMAFG